VESLERVVMNGSAAAQRWVYHNLQGRGSLEPYDLSQCTVNFKGVSCPLTEPETLSKASPRMAHHTKRLRCITTSAELYSFHVGKTRRSGEPPCGQNPRCESGRYASSELRSIIKYCVPKSISTGKVRVPSESCDERKEQRV
jgi:hypothetical protein